MDKTLYNELLKYIDSILRSNKILAIPDKAKFIRKQFYQFFDQPSFEEKPTREELEENRKEYIELYSPIKKLIQEFEVARTNGWEEPGMKKETLEIMEGIEDDLNTAINKIGMEIGKLQDDKQIEIGEESKYIAQESDKKAKRANVIAIISLIITITIGFLEIFNVI